MLYEHSTIDRPIDLTTSPLNTYWCAIPQGSITESRCDWQRIPKSVMNSAPPQSLHSTYTAPPAANWLRYSSA